jgi:hypothetical protein
MGKDLEGSGRSVIEVLSRNFPGQTWGKPRQISVMIAGAPVEEEGKLKL